MKMQANRIAGSLALVVAFVSVFSVVTVDAQSKKSAKQAESLEKAGESAKMAVEDALRQLQVSLAGYNSIIDGDSKDPQPAYKKLVDNFNATEKKISGAKKQMAGLDKEAGSFFKAWEEDLSGIESESLREKSAGRLEVARTRYAAMGDALARAGDELSPVVQNLKDQVLFLGRDLSPEAIADLKDDAEVLNQQATEAAEKIRAILQSAGKEQEEAEAALAG